MLEVTTPMKMKTTPNRLLTIVALAGALSGPVHAQTAATVATVNGTPITQTDVDTLLRASGQPDSPQIRQAIKNQLITRVLVQQAAEKANYADKPESRRRCSRRR